MFYEPLAVMGVWEEGCHEILHYEAADAESTDRWSAVLAALTQCGLDLGAMLMVVSVGTTGLPAALREHMPSAKQQCCTVYKIRGLERAFCYRELVMTDPTRGETLSFEQARRLWRQQLTTDAHAIFEAATRTEAEQRLASFQMMWSEREGYRIEPDLPPVRRQRAWAGAFDESAGTVLLLRVP